jgi:hypothetical protein
MTPLIPAIRRLCNRNFLPICGLFIISAALAEDAVVSKVPVGKETTFVTGPVDEEGFIDFDTAFNEHFGRGNKPDVNANVLLSKAIGPKAADERVRERYFKALGVPVPPERGEYFIALRDFLKNETELGFDEIKAAMEQLDEWAQRPWTAKDHPHLAAWLNANEKPLALVVEASKRSAYYNPRASRDWLFDGLQFGTFTYRQFGVALAARAMLHLADGKQDEAWKDLLASHRLARLISRDPSLILTFAAGAVERIVSAADISFLEQAKLSTKQLQDCLKDLQALPQFSPMVDKFDFCSRFEFLDACQAMRRGRLGGKSTDEELRRLNRLDWEMIMRDGNRWYDRIAAAMRLRSRMDREDDFKKIDDDFVAASKKAKQPGKVEDLLKDKNVVVDVVSNAIAYMLHGLTLPAFKKAAQFADEQEQVQRNLRVAFALSIYHSEKGRYPAKLEELAPKYLPQVPGDVFSGKPLVYHPTAIGYVLYSVGPNLRDDGGRGPKDLPAGDDLAVRVPRTETREKK